MSEEYKHLTLEEATAFFAEFYFGEHHIPGNKVKEEGYGFSVQHYGELSTFDWNNLTRFVIMCHDKCYRGQVETSRPGYLKLTIWKRQGREGDISLRHPEIEIAIENIRKHKAQWA